SWCPGLATRRRQGFRCRLVLSAAADKMSVSESPGKRPTKQGQVMKNVLAVVLAGGKGARLEPLTRDRAKPAVPFGGAYRIIDFALSNCINSDIRKILVMTQYKAMSLDRHINLGW